MKIENKGKEEKANNSITLEKLCSYSRKKNTSPHFLIEDKGKKRGVKKKKKKADTLSLSSPPQIEALSLTPDSKERNNKKEKDKRKNLLPPTAFKDSIDIQNNRYIVIYILEIVISSEKYTSISFLGYVCILNVFLFLDFGFFLFFFFVDNRTYFNIDDE